MMLTAAKQLRRLQKHLSSYFRETWFCQHSFMFTADQPDHTQVLPNWVYFNILQLRKKEINRGEWVNPQPVIH